MHRGIAPVSTVAIDYIWWCFDLPGVWHAVGALCETGEWGSPHSHLSASSGGDGLLSIFILLQPVFSLLGIFKTSQVFFSVIIISLSLFVVQPTALHLSISHLICLFSALLDPSRCLRFQKQSFPHCCAFPARWWEYLHHYGHIFHMRIFMGINIYSLRLTKSLKCDVIPKEEPALCRELPQYGVDSDQQLEIFSLGGRL